jgi:TonB C terminal
MDCSEIENILDGQDSPRLSRRYCMALDAHLSRCVTFAKKQPMRLAKRTAAGNVGVAAAVLLHLLFFAVVFWGVGAPKTTRLPDAVGAGANSGRQDGISRERMVVIQLSPEVSNASTEPTESPQMAEVEKQRSLLQVTGPDTIPLPPLEFDEEGEATEASEAEIIARTKLAGLYESQIRARIERAWVQPAEPVRALVYSCRVKVRQRRDGQVENVILDDCEGSYEWLKSLVKAIYSASPLPGPPHPGVFAYSFSMQFRSVAP